MVGIPGRLAILWRKKEEEWIWERGDVEGE